MIPYDAKVEQTCGICGMFFLHNKQGRFTSHLLHSHSISLHDYLLMYYYTKEDLKCASDFCLNTVKLRRGVPNTYCSKSCGNTKTKFRKCVVCGTLFENQDLRIRGCSEVCGNKLRSIGVAKWHKLMSEEYKKAHFAVIGKKTAMTRKKNYRPAWNKGKTGIYSAETIEKIRNATIRQFQTQSFRKTKIERIMENMLNKMGITNRYSFCIEKRQFDFVLPKHQIVIECDGDYWHANPKFYPNPKDWQLERIQIDQEKNVIARRNGYQILRFWEDDILNNLAKVRSTIATYVPSATTESETINVNA
ncbi:hypothetical protein BEP19_00925 [Ammoniphilus oxalaticus]|uniref:DUF559 domain-containing protein n=1 Tax=Ammoniphilus oxalaticus TaxID=66863 RepID=A0A419SMU3_9BACL|nr:DUF559 domain-containing protein [Ammoniphilus oxalaticus]RKD25539.1 hypothetical protein BEP19_00925 [Ammoniphilus oxalaticus]